MVHFNWTELIPGVGENIHVATLIVASILMLIMAVVGRLALGRGEAAMLPARSIGFKSIFESTVEFIVSICEMVIGEEGEEFVPFFATLFFFIFVSNLMGLLPGFTPPTDNVNTTFALGIFIFFYYNYLGIREHGIGYLKQFMGPLVALAPLMFVIELVSHFVRPFSLGLRLFGNMVGDHTVLSLFLGLVPYYLLPVIFYGLGLFVCFMQAFVFTILSMIYVSMAISHDH